jgi:putative cardiolipin synthase
MHNKLFIADNRFAVSGGRNIADEYFMRSESANFVDMDLLSAGPVVRELSAVFDRYWNSEQAYPFAALNGAVPPAQAARERFDALIRTCDGSATTRAAVELQPVAAQFERGWIDLTFAAVQINADDAAKAAPGAPAQATAMDSTLELFRAARSEVFVASPYFVPGERGLALMREAVGHGVRISVMTNSLAATDEPLAYWGYARYRKDMLKMGVRLGELSPTHVHRAGLFGGSSSLGRLHAKVALVDRRWLMIGSMNMDGRSSRTNTEIGLVIDSAELAEQVARLLGEHWNTSNYRLRVDASGERIEWIATEDELEVVHTDEPDTDWRLRLKLGLMSMFVSEDLL